MSDDDILSALWSPSKHLYVHKTGAQSVCLFLCVCVCLEFGVRVSVVIGDAISRGTHRCWHQITDTSAVGTHHPCNTGPSQFWGLNGNAITSVFLCFFVTVCVAKPVTNKSQNLGLRNPGFSSVAEIKQMFFGGPRAQEHRALIFLAGLWGSVMIRMITFPVRKRCCAPALIGGRLR